MALASYGDATAYILAALNRDDTDTTSQIGAFWRYAHDEIVRTLRLPLNRTTVTATVATERVALPSDFRSLESMAYVAPYGPEIFVTDAASRALLAEQHPSGQPTAVAVEGALTAAFAPVPDGPYAVNMIYMASPLLMSAPTDTNAIFAQNPWIYVHGALSAGFSFNHFTDEMQSHETMFRGMLADIRRQGLNDAFSGRLQPTSSLGFAP